MGASWPPRTTPIGLGEADDDDHPTLVPDFDPEDFARDSEIRQRTLSEAGGEPTVDEARRLHLDGDHEQALFLLRGLLERTPLHPEATKLAAECRAGLEQQCVSAIGSGAAVLIAAVSPEELKSFVLDNVSAFLFSRLDGATSVEEIVDISGLPRLLALRHLRNLLERGIIGVASGQRLSAPAEPADRHGTREKPVADDESMIENATLGSCSSRLGVNARWLIAGSLAAAGLSGCVLFGYDLGDYGGTSAEGGTSGEGSASDASGDESLANDVSGEDGVSPSGDAAADRDASLLDGTFEDSPTHDVSGDVPVVPCDGSSVSLRVFVTSQQFTAPQVGSLQNADHLCGAAATNAGLTGSFVAWLSDNTTSAINRLTPSCASFVLRDGTPVVMGTSGFASGTLLHAIDETETGQSAPTTPTACSSGKLAVWTGTDYTGLGLAFVNCQNWTSSGSVNGLAGYAQSSDSTWTYGCEGTQVCSGSGSLYCIEQ